MGHEGEEYLDRLRRGSSDGDNDDAVVALVERLRSRIAELENERDNERHRANENAGLYSGEKTLRELDCAERDRFKAAAEMCDSDALESHKTIDELTARAEAAESRLADFKERAELAEHYVQQRTDHEWVKATERVVEAARFISEEVHRLMTVSRIDKAVENFMDGALATELDPALAALPAEQTKQEQEKP